MNEVALLLDELSPRLAMALQGVPDQVAIDAYRSVLARLAPEDLEEVIAQGYRHLAFEQRDQVAEISSMGPTEFAASLTPGGKFSTPLAKLTLIGMTATAAQRVAARR